MLVNLDLHALNLFLSRNNCASMKISFEKFSVELYSYTLLLCQLTCQSADIMASLCRVDVRIRVSDFSETTRPRDMLFF